MTGVVLGTDFNLEKGYFFWNLGIDITLKSDLKYRSILIHLLFEKLFFIPRLVETRVKALKHLRWIEDWLQIMDRIR